MGRGQSVHPRVMLPTRPESAVVVSAEVLARRRSRADAVLREWERLAYLPDAPSPLADGAVLDRLLVLGSPAGATAVSAWSVGTLEQAGHLALAACRSADIVLGLRDLDADPTAIQAARVHFQVELEFSYIERRRDVLRGKALASAQDARIADVLAHYGAAPPRYSDRLRYLAVLRDASGKVFSLGQRDLPGAGYALSKLAAGPSGLIALWDLAPHPGPTEVPVAFGVRVGDELTDGVFVFEQ